MDLLGAIGRLLPLALAAAISSVPITILLVLLLSSRRKVAAVPYALGCLVGTALVVLLASYASQLLPQWRMPGSDAALGVLEMVLGAALVALGIRRWLQRARREARPRQLPAWAAAALDKIGPVRALGLGLLIEFRPKSLLLAGVAGVQVSGVPRISAAVGLIIGYVVIATVTVTVPVLLTMIDPGRMEPRLSAAARTLAASGTVISAVVLVMVGVVVIGVGLQDLA